MLTSAGTGKKAIDILKTEKIDLFFLDIELSDISGMEIAEVIRSIEYYEFSYIVFITTPDGAIEDTCDSISRNNGIADSTIVLHCSGALPSTILSTAKACGAYSGSMHPLQSFASADYEHNPFQGIIVAVEGDQEAVQAAKEIASDLGATAVTLLTEAKTLYHASAVSNPSKHTTTPFTLARVC